MLSPYEKKTVPAFCMYVQRTVFTLPGSFIISGTAENNLLFHCDCLKISYLAF